MADPKIAVPQPRSEPLLPPFVRKVLKPFASLQVTVALFALSMVLVFFGTMAQMNNGIWTVVDQYFWSWHVWIPFDLVGKFAARFFDWAGYPRDTTLAHGFPFPGGKAIGAAMFVNLLAAHAVRFRFTWKRSGVLIVHAGLILLFVGEGITREHQVEQKMVIPEGGSTNYAANHRTYELAAVDVTDPNNEIATVVPHKMLAAGGKIDLPGQPFAVEVVEYMPNAAVRDLKAGETPPGTAGLGTKYVAERQAEVSGVDAEGRADLPAVLVRIVEKDGRPIGTHLLSLYQDVGALPADPLKVGDKSYQLSLRNTRYYKPFSVSLKKFRFDRFVGTSMARNYSSDVTLIDPDRNVTRDHHIKMNEPLTYRGETFYQQSFGADERSTVLQVVRNPGQDIPYIACTMISGGMLLHFGMMLVAFLKKPRTGTAPSAKEPVPALTGPLAWLPVAAVAFAAVFLIGVAMSSALPTAPLDLQTAGHIPVVDGGRLKPLDTVARVSLRAISAKESFKDAAGVEQPAIRWLLDVMTDGLPARTPDDKAGKAATYKVFKIENDQVLGFLGLSPRKGFLYGLDEFAGKIDALGERADEADKREKEKKADLFDFKAMELAKRVRLYFQLASGRSPLVVPTDSDRANWIAFDAAFQQARQAAVMAIRSDPRFQVESLDKMPEAQRAEMLATFKQDMDKRLAARPAGALWAAIMTAYSNDKPDEFNKALATHSARFADTYGPAAAKAEREAQFNAFAPFYQCVWLYGIALLLCLGQLVAAGIGNTNLTTALRRATFGLLAMTAVIHLVALVARMYFQDRWLVFVTNLYSSAIFIGLGCVALGLALEHFYPIGIGNLTASALGLTTSIIAHNLGASGDTLEMMQAVLDTNFWLATHVTCVTLGYTATFVAGAIGIAYVILGLSTNTLRGPANKTFADMMYAVVAFATLLSFTGTVLGGIWADYSWGRFWGWDPKENGAVLIVIWNALILHARWAGLAKARGVAVLAIMGNMVTVWSWFGTNQLGLGLHAYGFDNSTARWCSYAWLAHLALVGVGLLPLGVWRSFRKV